MIKINISDKIWKEIEEKHGKYVEDVILPRWDNVVGMMVNKDKVTQDEKNDIEIALTDKSISLNKDLFIDREIDKYAWTSEELVNNSRIKIKKERLVDIVLHVFGYTSKFNDIPKVNKADTWNRHELLLMLNVKVCPYCNRQYVTSYQRADGTRWSTADIDHYYPKKVFPLLSMNVHNMIPSCNVCNSRLKNERVKTREDIHLYPYVDGSESLSFAYDDSLLEQVWIGAKKEEELKLFLHNNSKEKRQKDRGEKSKIIFRLNEVYEVHQSDMMNLINKYRNYNEWYFRNVQKKDYPEVMTGYQELQNMIFDFLYKDVGEEPLIKMKKDIYKQLKNDPLQKYLKALNSKS